jgi:hypothetical protein
LLPYSGIKAPSQKTRILAVLLISGMPLLSQAQWRAITYKNTLVDTVYSLQTDTSQPKPVLLNFPEYFFRERPPTRGIAVALGESSAGRNSCLWVKPVKGPLDPAKDTMAIKQFLFCDKVRAYSVFLYSTSRKSWFRLRNEVNYQGFQEPAILMTSQFREINDSAEVAVLNNSMPLIQKGQGLIAYRTENDPGETRFVIGDITIGHILQKEVLVENPFFDSLIHQAAPETARAPEFVSESVQNLPPFYMNPTLTGYIEIKGNGGNEMDLLKKTILQCLDRYPYYMEYAVDKASARADFLNVWESHAQSSSCDLLDAVASFIESRFRDGHFRLVTSNECKTKNAANTRVPSPVRVYAIGDSLYVAAVLDTLYHIPIGSPVVEIDHRAARFLIDSLRALQEHDGKALQNKKAALDASVLLERVPTDSSLITYVHGTENMSACLKFDRRLNIPANFRPVHAELRSYEGNHIAYFRINNWFQDVNLRLLNDWDSLKSAEALIIDLRGNGGGEMFSGVRIFSLFIRKSIPFAIAEDLNTHSRGTVVARPNPLYHFPESKPVIILGDINTACASESFIYAMKQLPNVTYISADDRTLGMIASRYDIHFPSGFYLTNDAITGRIVMPDGMIIEHYGIKPDVKVDIHSVFDLKPYQDKVLQTAISIAKQQYAFSLNHQ